MTSMERRTPKLSLRQIPGQPNCVFLRPGGCISAFALLFPAKCRNQWLWRESRRDTTTTALCVPKGQQICRRKRKPQGKGHDEEKQWQSGGMNPHLGPRVVGNLMVKKRMKICNSTVSIDNLLFTSFPSCSLHQSALFIATHFS